MDNSVKDLLPLLIGIAFMVLIILLESQGLLGEGEALSDNLFVFGCVGAVTTFVASLVLRNV